MKLQYLIFSLLGVFAPIYSVNNQTESVLIKTQQPGSFVKNLEKAIKKSIPSSKQALFLSVWMAAGYYGLNNFEGKFHSFENIAGNMDSTNLKLFKAYPWYNKLFASPLATLMLPMAYSQEFINKNILFKNPTLMKCYGIIGLLVNRLTLCALENDFKSNLLLSLLIFSTITILNYEEVSKDKKDKLINTEKN